MYSFGYAIPCLNGAGTLSWTLHSLQGQTHGAPRVCLVDSGSQDDSVAISQRWQVPVMNCPPGNMYAAVDVGLREQSADFLGYINCDDMLYPDALARFAAAAERSGADVLYGACDYIDGYGRPLYCLRPPAPTTTLELLSCGYMPFAQPAAVFRREVLEALGGFGDRFRHIGDFYFYLRAARRGFRFERVPGPAVVQYRLHPGQLERRDAGRPEREKAELRGEHRSRVSWRCLAARARWQGANLRGYAVRRLLAPNATGLDRRAVRDHTRGVAGGS